MASKKNKPSSNRIAKVLRAKKRGRVKTGAGYFNALQTAEEVRVLRKKSNSKNKG